MHTTFEQRMDSGKKAEELFRLDIQLRGYEILETPPDVSFRPYDFKIKHTVSGKILTAEIKNDSVRSPNVAVEFQTSNRPSGIDSTEADLYWILNGGLWYVAHVDALRLWIEENSPQIRKNTKNSYGTYIYTVPKYIYQPYQKGEGQDFFILEPKLPA